MNYKCEGLDCFTGRLVLREEKEKGSDGNEKQKAHGLSRQ